MSDVDARRDAPSAVRGTLRTLSLQLAAAAVMAGVWALAVRLELLDDTILPPVQDVAARFIEVSTTSRLWEAVRDTTVGAVAGIAIAAVIGVPVGIALGMSPRWRNATRVLVDLGRSFPMVALLPVLVLLLGASSEMKIVVVVLACLWPILLQSRDGARRLDPVVLDTVTAFRVPFGVRFGFVVLPNAGPYIATGIRIATAAAILVSIAVEVLTQVPGLGRLIVVAQQGGATDSTLAYIMYAGMLGITLNALVWRTEQRLLAWHHRRVTR